MNLCSNCGYKVPIGSMICPNCRARLVPNTSWPPEPVNVYTPSAIEIEKLITGRRWGDLALGFIASFALFLLPFVAYIAGPLIYFGIRRRDATFARGFGFGVLSATVLSFIGLGVFIYQLMNGDIHFPC